MIRLELCLPFYCLFSVVLFFIPLFMPSFGLIKYFKYPILIFINFMLILQPTRKCYNFYFELLKKCTVYLYRFLPFVLLFFYSQICFPLVSFFFHLKKLLLQFFHRRFLLVMNPLSFHSFYNVFILFCEWKLFLLDRDV